MKYAAIGAALALSLLGTVAVAQPRPEPRPAQAEAQSQAQADMLVLHGTNTGKGIGKKIRELPYKLPQLEKPPLSSYDSYELLDNKQLPLPKDKNQQLTLPDKSVVRIKLTEVLPPKKPKGKPKYVLSASITGPGGKKVLPKLTVNAAPGQIFFVAGPAYKKGKLVIGIRVLVK